MDDKDLSRKALSLAADPLGKHNTAKEQAARNFERAHWRAIIQDMLAIIRYEPVDLLPFEEVRKKLRLGSNFYLGVQDIPLAQIVGSVSRYEDFTRTFMPRKINTRERWERIDRLVNTSQWEPIEVYKVSDTYFVRDGNHRVSVARQLDMETIEAHVWEYLTRVPLEPDDDIDDLIIRAEYLEFLEDTYLDELRPDQYIILTQPGDYWKLEEAIAIHRHWQSQECRAEVPWLEAVADWYDNIYLALINKIREEDILSFFPGRTEADLVLWVLRHWEKLEREDSGEEVLPAEVVEDFAERVRANIPQRVWAWVERIFLGKPVDEE